MQLQHVTRMQIDSPADKRNFEYSDDDVSEEVIQRASF